MNSLYESIQKKLRKIADIQYSCAVLQWDQETYMPKNGYEFRSEQIATLSGIAHELFTEKKLEEDLLELMSVKGLDEKEEKNISLILEELEKQKKLSSDFVERSSKAVSDCFQKWNKAREENKAEIYLPSLEKLIEIKKEEIQLLGFKEHPYDALLNQYEKGITVQQLDKLFSSVREQLHPLLKKIYDYHSPDDSFFYQSFDKNLQWSFGISLLRQMGYDFDSGRQDISAHPFTINFSPQDVRVTTRIDENNLSEMIWSCIHEGGHALYEQGLVAYEYGMPLGEAISLGIHESQSRLWENQVGRSESYWIHHYKELKNIFPQQLKEVSEKQFYHACNKVQPSLIRTNADELTYHFHILIRYELEKALFIGDLKVSELKGAWNDLYQKELGIVVPDDRQGILQDVHWSHGSFGYFPTYSLGSFYAAQFYQTAEKEITDLSHNLKEGKFDTLLDWLRTKIHRHGKFYSAQELCKKISGEELKFDYFLTYAQKKYQGIYNFT